MMAIGYMIIVWALGAAFIGFGMGRYGCLRDNEFIIPISMAWPVSLIAIFMASAILPRVIALTDPIAERFGWEPPGSGDIELVSVRWSQEAARISRHNRWDEATEISEILRRQMDHD